MQYVLDSLPDRGKERVDPFGWLRAEGSPDRDGVEGRFVGGENDLSTAWAAVGGAFAVAEPFLKAFVSEYMAAFEGEWVVVCVEVLGTYDASLGGFQLPFDEVFHIVHRLLPVALALGVADDTRFLIQRFEVAIEETGMQTCS